MSRDTLRNLNNDSGSERRLHEIFKRRMGDVEAGALGGGRQLAVRSPRSKSAKPLLQDFFFLHIQATTQRRRGRGSPKCNDLICWQTWNLIAFFSYTFAPRR